MNAAEMCLKLVGGSWHTSIWADCTRKDGLAVWLYVLAGLHCICMCLV